MKALSQMITVLLLFYILLFSLPSAYGVEICNSLASTNDTDTLTDSGGIGGNYANNESCNFLIQPDGASTITLTFSAFRLENGFDFLTIYDGPTTASPILANSLSGDNIPGSVTSSGGSMLVRFTSDFSISSSGFIASWSSVGAVNSCPAESIDDNFTNVSYSQNTGSQNWSGDWIEVGESDGVSAGIARVRNDLCSGGNCLRLGVPSGNPAQSYSNRGVFRESNLDSVSSATLSFVYRSGVSQGSQSVVLSISDNGGSSWTNLQTYTMNSSNTSPTSATFDISANATSNTQVRFLASGNNAIIGMYIDDISISYQPICSTLLMEYQFEETSWDGTLDEVIDNTGNEHHARVNNNSIPEVASPALTGNPGTCGYASQNDGSIEVTGLPLNTTTNGIKTTVTFWMNWDGTDNVMPVGWNFHDIWLRNGSMGFNTWNSDIYGISSANLANEWHHIAVEFTNGSITDNRIHIDGVEQVLTQRRGFPRNSFAFVNSEMRVGGVSNSTGFDFHGFLDEFRVYESALTTDQIRTIMAERHACNTEVIHHYEISHDGQGLTCDSESVTVKACMDQNCSTLSTESVTLDFLIDGSLINAPTFIGSTTVNFNHTTADTLTFSLDNASIEASNAVVCDDGSGNSCDMAFEDASFRFLYGSSNATSIPNQESGVVFGDTLKVQAVKSINGVCTGLFNGNKAIDLSQENIEPGGFTGLKLNIDTANLNTEIKKHTDATNVTLNFDADSIATIPTPIYHDAGKIRLHAKYNVGGVILSGSSNNSFWVIPNRLEVSAKSGSKILNGNSSSHSTTHKAGEAFDLTVSAYNAATPSVITPNYSPGQIELKLERTEPTAAGGGKLTYASSSQLNTSLNGNPSLKFVPVILTDFNSGVSIFTSAQYSEVGLINLAIQDRTYGNPSPSPSDPPSIPATAINIGRFTPAYFKQTVVDKGELGTGCTGIGAMFAYSGQKNDAGNAGTISYNTEPVLAITAFNANDIPIQNYYNHYKKLTADKVHNSISATTLLDQAAVGVDANNLPITASMKAGELSEIASGELHYELSGSDDFYYERSANALIKPFRANIKFSIRAIEDEDGIKITSFEDLLPDGNGVEIRFGRLRLENSFGPETVDLPQPMRIEHFDGTSFVVSSDDNCVDYDKSKLTKINLDPLSPDPLGGVGSFEKGKTDKIKLKASGAGNRGKIEVLYKTYDWLKYDWKNDDGLHNDNPTAVATFGLFRGNDRIIYWHEVSK
jgi:MSHA biogenesis protein MshQ